MTPRLLLTSLALFLSLSAQLASQVAESRRLVTVGKQKMFLNCTGNESNPTVILEAGTGDTSEVWTVVQKRVEVFAHVCSYDRLGLGRSDKLVSPHTAEEIVGDLHSLLQAAPVSSPYVMVGHSIGGIYVRKYASLYPSEVEGIVLVDSAHEEQFSRVAALSPEWASRIAKKFSADDQHANGFLPANEKLAWRLDKPLTVIEHVERPPNGLPIPWPRSRTPYFMFSRRISLAGRNMGSFERQSRAAITFSATSPTLLSRRSGMSSKKAENPMLEQPAIRQVGDKS